MHPTTIGYGILAQEVIDVMGRAGVELHHRDGTPRTTLISDPPPSIGSNLKLIGWIDQHLGFLRRLID